MPTWLIWLIVAIVALVVLFLIFRAINRAFKHKYGFSLLGGGFLILIGGAALAGGIVLVMNKAAFGYALFIVTAITFIFTLVYDVKKCGGGAILAFFLQILFCVPSLWIIIDVAFNHGRDTMNVAIEEDIYERRRARRRRNRY